MFQEFILTSYMCNHDKFQGTGFSFDKLMPPARREHCVETLVRAAERFLKGDVPQPEHRGTTLHNLAFVLQTIADRHMAAREFAECRNGMKNPGTVAWRARRSGSVCVTPG